MAKLKEKEEQKNALEKVNMNIRYIDSLQKGLCNPVINIEKDKEPGIRRNYENICN